LGRRPEGQRRRGCSPATISRAIHTTRQVGKHIVKCLEPFQKKDVKYGFISTKDDFKYLAKKVRGCGDFVAGGWSI
jgi:hypothetical protein